MPEKRERAGRVLYNQGHADALQDFFVHPSMFIDSEPDLSSFPSDLSGIPHAWNFYDLAKETKKKRPPKNRTWWRAFTKHANKQEKQKLKNTNNQTKQVKQMLKNRNRQREKFR